MTDLQIRAVVLDVDGVLTDNRFIWGSDSSEYKRFNYRDVNGISLAVRAGIAVGLLSGESSPITKRLADRLGLDFVLQGHKDKGDALLQMGSQMGVDVHEIAFMGDDLYDLPALEICGLPACPEDAHPDVISICRFVAKRAGGDGAVRTLIDHMIRNKQL